MGTEVSRCAPDEGKVRVCRAIRAHALRDGSGSFDACWLWVAEFEGSWCQDKGGARWRTGRYWVASRSV